MLLMLESLKSDTHMAPTYPTYGATIIGLGVSQKCAIDIRHGAITADI
jgi:hypothetical protein